MLSLSKQIVLLNRLRQAQADIYFFKLLHYPFLKTAAAGSAGNGCKGNRRNRPLYMPVLLPRG